MEHDGYSVKAVDAALKERGPDIIATKSTETLLVEVKGWPALLIADGPRRGQAKKAPANLQAKHWFGDALLTLVIAKTNHPDYLLILGVPDFQRYRDLAKLTQRSFDLLGFEIWFVNEKGIVKKGT